MLVVWKHLRANAIAARDCSARTRTIYRTRVTRTPFASFVPRYMLLFLLKLRLMVFLREIKLHRRRVMWLPTVIHLEGYFSETVTCYYVIIKGDIAWLLMLGTYAFTSRKKTKILHCPYNSPNLIRRLNIKIYTGMAVSKTGTSTLFLFSKIDQPFRKWVLKPVTNE